MISKGPKIAIAVFLILCAILVSGNSEARELDNVPVYEGITTWLVTSFYADKHCQDLSRTTYESYGSCFKSNSKAIDGGDLYYMDILKPTSNAMLGAVLTYYYTNGDCSVRRIKMPPTTDSVDLYPSCSNIYGVYQKTEVYNQREPPSFPLTGGYMFSYYSEPSCSTDAATFYAIARADTDSCITKSNKTSVSYQCLSADENENGGVAQKMMQYMYSCADCSCEGTKTSRTIIMSECSTKSLTNKDLYYSTICTTEFPTPTAPPLPSPGITAWIVTTEYGSDDTCTEEAATGSLLESFGLCVPVQTKDESSSALVYKIDVLETFEMTADQAPLTTYFFSDETCETAAEGMESTTSMQELLGGTCAFNPATQTYSTVEVVDRPEEPMTAFTGGFVYSASTSDQCFSDQKLFSMVSVLNTCVQANNGTMQSSYRMTCSADGKSVLTKSFTDTSDCTGRSRLITRSLDKCIESPDEPGQFITLECLDEFPAPTPAPDADELPINIQGWVTTRQFEDGVCSNQPLYESSFSVGLCVESEVNDSETGDSQVVYKTSQVTDATTDEYVVITTFYFMNEDCSGEYYQDPTDQRYDINNCQVNDYSPTPELSENRRLATTRHPTRRPSKAPTNLPPRPSSPNRAPTHAPTDPTSSITAFRPGMMIPQPPYRGGYYYVTYGNEDCSADTAIFVYVAPENQCLKYHNGTAMVSTSYTCDEDGSGGVSIDDFDSEDCTGSFSRSNSEATTCAPESDGTYSSLQCVTEFPSPTAAPVLSADINAWVAVDYFGQDATCKTDPLSSYATSYGLCLPADTQDEDGNELYYVDAIEATESDDDVEVPLTTYYYSDSECTIDAVDPVDSVVTLYHCEKDTTGQYAVSYFIEGPDAPEVPYAGGYLNAVYDDTSCDSERKVQFVSSSDGECAADVDSETNKMTSYIANCELDGSGVTIKTFSKPNCMGSSKTSFMDSTPCALLDEDDEGKGSYSIECGEFSSPTPAPAPIQREISAWLGVETFSGAGCHADKRLSWTTESYGLCISMFNATHGTTLTYVRQVSYNKKAPDSVTISAILYEDDSCNFPLQVAVADLNELNEKVAVNTCVNQEGGFSTRTTFAPGPVPPKTPYSGGYMVQDYNNAACAYDSIVSISIVPADNACLPRVDPNSDVQSYSVSCDSDSGATIVRYSSKDCTGDQVDSFLQTKEECVDATEDESRVFNSYVCTSEFLPTPTGPPVPAPSASVISGWVTETKYGTETCDELQKSESFSIGLCKADYDIHADAVKFMLQTGTISDEGKSLTISTYFYEDEDCTMFRNEADEMVLEDLGACNDGGDGFYYKQVLHQGVSYPQDPFDGGLIQMDYSTDGCSESSLTHVIYDPANNLCVNSTSPSNDDDYSFFVTGSETYSCTYDGVQIRHYNDTDCQGEYTVEHVRNTQCASKEREGGDMIHYSLKCFVPAVEGEPTNAPIVAPNSKISFIDFVATQTILGCSYKEFSSDPQQYEKALKTAIAGSCGTSSIIPADIQYITVSQGISDSRRLHDNVMPDQAANDHHHDRRHLSSTARDAVAAARQASRSTARIIHDSHSTSTGPKHAARHGFTGPLIEAVKSSGITRRLLATPSLPADNRVQRIAKKRWVIKSLSDAFATTHTARILHSVETVDQHLEMTRGLSAYAPCTKSCPSGPAPKCNIFQVSLNSHLSSMPSTYG